MEVTVKKGEYYDMLVGLKSLSGGSVLYDYKLPFSLVLKGSLDSLMERIRQNKASMILVDGNVGMGKTTLALHCADYVNIFYGNGLPVALDKEHTQLAIGGKDFQEKLLVCHDNKMVVMVYDEAGDFDKKTTISRFNRNLMRVFEMYRGFKVLVILCLPKFYKLENELFELGIPRMLLNVCDRSERQASFKAYDLEQMYYIKHHAQKIIVKPKAYEFGQANFMGHFLDLPPERSRDLDRIGIAAKRLETKKAIYDVKNKVTLEMIAKHFLKSPRWCLLKIRELGGEVGEVITFQKRKWYPKEILSQIENLEDGG